MLKSRFAGGIFTSSGGVEACGRRKSAKRPVGLNTVQMLKTCSTRLGMSPAETMRPFGSDGALGPSRGRTPVPRRPTVFLREIQETIEGCKTKEVL